MSNFEQLHPALQHHIVNSLGWRELRPFQEAVIPAILAGQHMIVLAPTAGGKTEAAFLPVAVPHALRGLDGPERALHLPDQGPAQQPRHSPPAVLHAAWAGGRRSGTAT